MCCLGPGRFKWASLFPSLPAKGGAEQSWEEGHSRNATEPSVSLLEEALQREGAAGRGPGPRASGCQGEGRAWPCSQRNPWGQGRASFSSRPVFHIIFGSNWWNVTTIWHLSELQRCCVGQRSLGEVARINFKPNRFQTVSTQVLLVYSVGEICLLQAYSC